MSANDPRVPQAIMQVTNDPRIREAMMVGSYLETTWDPTSVGDQGTSFGPFQMHIGGELTAQGGTPSQAQDPVWAAQHMLASYTRGVNRVSASLWQSDPARAAEQAAVFAEVPAQDYYATQGASRVSQAWAATQKALGGSAGSTLPAINIPGLGGIPGVGGGDILSSLLSLFGISDIKDLAERGGLIIFGAILVFVGLFVATKSEGKVKETIKEQLPGGGEVTETKETKEPKDTKEKVEPLAPENKVDQGLAKGTGAEGASAGEAAEVAEVAV